METHFELSDAEFENHFISCKLSPANFNHEAHLRLAWLNINRYGLQQGQKNVQQQLQNFVAHVGAADKYHVTLTIFATQAVNHFMTKSKSDNFKDFILEFPELKDDFKNLIKNYYSFDILKSTKAREEFMEPDLLSL